MFRHQRFDLATAELSHKPCSIHKFDSKDDIPSFNLTPKYDNAQLASLPALVPWHRRPRVPPHPECVFAWQNFVQWRRAYRYLLSRQRKCGGRPSSRLYSRRQAEKVRKHGVGGKIRSQSSSEHRVEAMLNSARAQRLWERNKAERIYERYDAYERYWRRQTQHQRAARNRQQSKPKCLPIAYHCDDTFVHHMGLSVNPIAYDHLLSLQALQNDPSYSHALVPHAAPTPTTNGPEMLAITFPRTDVAAAATSEPQKMDPPGSKLDELLRRVDAECTRIIEEQLNAKAIVPYVRPEPPIDYSDDAQWALIRRKMQESLVDYDTEPFNTTPLGQQVQKTVNQLHCDLLCTTVVDRNKPEYLTYRPDDALGCDDTSSIVSLSFNNLLDGVAEDAVLKCSRNGGTPSTFQFPELKLVLRRPATPPVAVDQNQQAKLARRQQRLQQMHQRRQQQWNMRTKPRKRRLQYNTPSQCDALPCTLIDTLRKVAARPSQRCLQTAGDVADSSSSVAFAAAAVATEKLQKKKRAMMMQLPQPKLPGETAHETRFVDVNNTTALLNAQIANNNIHRALVPVTAPEVLLRYSCSVGQIVPNRTSRQPRCPIRLAMMIGHVGQQSDGADRKRASSGNYGQPTNGRGTKRGSNFTDCRDATNVFSLADADNAALFAPSTESLKLYRL